VIKDVCGRGDFQDFAQRAVYLHCVYTAKLGVYTKCGNKRVSCNKPKLTKDIENGEN